MADYQTHRMPDTGELEHEEPEPMTWQSLPPDTDPALLWDTVLGALKTQVTRPIFETYLRETGAARNVDGRLAISAPSYAPGWLGTKLRPLIVQTVAGLSGVAVAVDFATAEDGK